jgi:hypothetical protein
MGVTHVAVKLGDEVVLESRAMMEPVDVLGDNTSKSSSVSQQLDG